MSLHTSTQRNLCMRIPGTQWIWVEFNSNWWDVDVVKEVTVWPFAHSWKEVVEVVELCVPQLFQIFKVTKSWWCNSLHRRKRSKIAQKMTINEQNFEVFQHFQLCWLQHVKVLNDLYEELEGRALQARWKFSVPKTVWSAWTMTKWQRKYSWADLMIDSVESCC